MMLSLAMRDRQFHHEPLNDAQLAMRVRQFHHEPLNDAQFSDEGQTVSPRAPE